MLGALNLGGDRYKIMPAKKRGERRIGWFRETSLILFPRIGTESHGTGVAFQVEQISISCMRTMAGEKFGQSVAFARRKRLEILFAIYPGPARIRVPNRPRWTAMTNHAPLWVVPGLDRFSVYPGCRMTEFYFAKHKPAMSGVEFHRFQRVKTAL